MPPLACVPVCVQVASSGACVCDSATLQAVASAARTALNAVPGLLVGVWFLYVFGEWVHSPGR